jgi:predicted transcriptional regulator
VGIALTPTKPPVTIRPNLRGESMTDLEDKEAKFAKAFPESSRLLERVTDLGKIYAFLGFDKISDKRLQVKADIMKKVLSYCSEWKSGNEKQWIDKLANRTCVSTRKIREDYIDPLVSEGILEKTSEGNIRFSGLPKSEMQ